MVTFESSGRTVDMLGRQQIAGASTALSEVFKNAHDAYAEHVRVDILPEERALLVRDDGVGMSFDAFQKRWLTLAASKANDDLGATPPAGRKARPVLGAKGIGRLAIATIGPHVLVLSRASGEPLVMAFVNWDAFSYPGLNLSDIEIPTRKFDGVTPTAVDVRQLVETAKSSLRSALLGRRDFGEDQNEHDVSAAIASLETFSAEAFDALTSLPGPCLSATTTGTSFLVSPLGEEISADLAAHAAEDLDISKELLGFSKSAVPGAKPPRLATSMFVHAGGTTIDVLGGNSFLTPDEFMLCDHTIRGAFDSDGDFRGEVRIYGGAAQPYAVRWADLKGTPVARAARCGPFSLDLAVIQGSAKDSRLDSAAHKILSDKLARLGGVYVYRDDIRVLPYGRPDVDWLDIEQRRSKNLSKAYFSHRRMFGAVSVREGTGLVEKAGREGFQKNSAYRDLQEILQRFLERLAADFFVAGGTNADQWVSHKARLKSDVEALARRDREKHHLESERAAFQASIVDRYSEIRDGAAQRAIDAIVKAAQRSHEAALRGDGIEAVESAVARASHQVLDLVDRLRLEPPPDLPLTDEIERDLATLRAKFHEFEVESLTPARRAILDITRRSETGAMIGDQLRLSLSPSKARGGSQVEQEVSALASSIVNLRMRADRLQHEVASFVDAGLLAVEKLIDEADLTSPAMYVEVQAGLEREVHDVFGNARSALSGFRAAVDAVAWERLSSTFWTSSTERVQQQREVDSLSESVVQSADLALQGMTLAILDHEFNIVVRSLRRSLDEIQAWADVNPALRPSVDRVSSSFEQLDGFLAIFAPLRRSNSRQTTNITGHDLERFINSVFADRAKESETKLIFTDRFAAHAVYGHRSVWYPVLVNLIDNALYWVQRSEDHRAITLDVVDGCIQVADTGPGISDSDVPRIWELRFSRKPGGSGLGLAISQDALLDEGYELVLVATGPHGSVFAICRRRGENPDG